MVIKIYVLVFKNCRLQPGPHFNKITTKKIPNILVKPNPVKHQPNPMAEISGSIIAVHMVADMFRAKLPIATFVAGCPVGHSVKYVVFATNTHVMPNPPKKVNMNTATTFVCLCTVHP